MSLCLLGNIVGVHGVRGWLKVQVFSNIPDRFTYLDRVLIGEDEDSAEEVEIESSADSGSLALLKIVSVDDRNEAESYVGLSIYITDEQMLPPPEGMHYVHELIGCEAIDAHTGKVRGTVTDVMLLPANDVYVVNDGGREILVPAVPEFINNVDTKNKRITINPVPGLFAETDED